MNVSLIIFYTQTTCILQSVHTYVVHIVKFRTMTAITMIARNYALSLRKVLFFIKYLYELFNQLIDLARFIKKCMYLPTLKKHHVLIKILLITANGLIHNNLFILNFLNIGKIIILAQIPTLKTSAVLGRALCKV